MAKRKGGFGQPEPAKIGQDLLRDVFGDSEPVPNEVGAAEVEKWPAQEPVALEPARRGAGRPRKDSADIAKKDSKFFKLDAGVVKRMKYFLLENPGSESALVEKALAAFLDKEGF